MRTLFLILSIGLAAPATGAAQAVYDTIYYYTQGDIRKQVYELETVHIRPSCKCAGVCTCSGALSSKGFCGASLFAPTDEILSITDGVTLTRRGNYAWEPGLRNLSGSQINVTIDGMKVFGACTDKMDPVTSYLEPNNLRNLSVAQGTAGAREGSTIGGSISLKLNEPIINAERPFRGEAGLGFQSASLGLNTLLSMNYSGQKWAVLVSGVYRWHQDYRAGDGSRIDHSQYRKGNFSASAKFLLTPTDILKLDFLLDDARNVGYPALPMDVAYAKAYMYGLTFKKFPERSSIRQWEFKAYANTVNHAMDDTDRPEVVMHMDMPGNTLTAGSFSELRAEWGRHRLDFRVEGYYNSSYADMTMYPEGEAPMFMLTWPDVRRGNGGAFLQYAYETKRGSEWQLDARTEVLTSVAVSDQGIAQMDVFGYDISERDVRLLKTFHTTYKLNPAPRASLQFSAGYGERAPSVSEQYAFYIFNAQDGYDYLGKPDIANEKSAQAEVGALFASDKVEVKPSVYYYYLMDYITGSVDPELSAMTPGALGVKFYENLKGAHLLGTSLRVVYRPIAPLALSGQAEYSYGRDLNGGALPRIMPLRGRFAVQYEGEKFLVLAECEFAAKQDRIAPLSGDTATPGYALLHLRGTYTFDLKALELRLNAGVENVLDADYREHLDWGGIPRPGINAYVNVNLGF